MPGKLIAAAMMALFLAACSATPDSDGSTSGLGGAQNGAQSAQSGGLGGGGLDGSGGGDGPPPGTQADLETNVGDRVFFDTDSSSLNATARSTLDRQAEWLRRYPSVVIAVEGHCDERGTREYNLALGDRRANAVRNYLIASGVDSARISAISFGEERPLDPGHNAAAWSQNRRATTIVTPLS